MNTITITSKENNLQITFSEHITTEKCSYGIADFHCIKVDFQNLENQKEYVYINDTEEVMIRLTEDDLIKFKQFFQNQYKKATKKSCNNSTSYIFDTKNYIHLTLMEDDNNLDLVFIDNVFYLKISTFIGNIIDSVNIFPYNMQRAYATIFHFLNK
jgi:hypothetical protein